MEAFLTKALDVVSGNEGVIPLVIIAVLSFVSTMALSKTVMLNQEQSFVMLAFIFIGSTLFLILIYTIFSKPNKGNETSVSKVKQSNVEIDHQTDGNKTVVEDISGTSIVKITNRK